MDATEFRKRGKEVVDAIADYYESMADMPPLSTVEPGYLYKIMPLEAPEEPESFDEIQRDIQSKIMPGVTHWQSGNFFAWYPSNSSFAGILGEMYSAMFSVVGFSWLSSPAATELETVVMDWLGKLVGLDRRFLSIREDGTEGDGGGVIQGTASEALVVAMLAARDMALVGRRRAQGAATEKEGEEEDDGARSARLVAYFSDQTHSSGEKAANILGCRPHAIRSDGSYRLTKGALLDAVRRDRAAGLVPFFVCGTFGTTNTAAIDDLAGITEAARDERLWFHVDAAYAGAALCCPEFRPLARGIERADSFSFNPHKWMLTTFDCSALWVADSTHLVRALSVHREYLPRTKGTTSFAKDYRDWQIPLGRRFRALKLWLVMRTYGAAGIRAHIRAHVAEARWLEEQLVADGRFEIVVPVVFGLVVFRIRPGCLFDGGGSSSSSSEEEEAAANRANTELVQRANTDGRVFLLGSRLRGVDVVRVAIGGAQTSHRNVALLLEVLTKAADDIVPGR
ncbi:hypothetical protein H4R18_005101 [Coemansia javaensis]|uniref:Aromatic-L-amino-acid decarboxylase n=1 Tax=Coemansia javaensis TaxID=2761396 RepID=A0A9W8H738_9FUNG|nr:hypothetical protein H4R18_005101 [Coemansia javaensis]